MMIRDGVSLPPSSRAEEDEHYVPLPLITIHLSSKIRQHRDPAGAGLWSELYLWYLTIHYE